jgi:hypothetical protein
MQKQDCDWLKVRDAARYTVVVTDPRSMCMTFACCVLTRAGHMQAALRGPFRGMIPEGGREFPFVLNLCCKLPTC